VSPAVLIPRPETEVLIELALEVLPAGGADVVDLGTGSGIVAVSLALECPGATVSAVDCRPGAGRRPQQCRPPGRESRFPRRRLVRTAGRPALRPHRFQPALCGRRRPASGTERPAARAANGADRWRGGNGLACIRRIVADAAAHLNPGGWLLFEHGYDQGEASRNLLAAPGSKRHSLIPTWPASTVSQALICNLEIACPTFSNASAKP
jgi:release factor glutamine methyltransferase